MGCVTVCVVLVIIGNVGSFVINRTNTDLERTIKNHFGLPPVFSKSMHHVSHNIDLDTNGSEQNTETEEVYSSQRDFEKTFKSFYSQPLLSNEHASHTVMKDHKRKISFTGKENEDIPQGVLDSVFGTLISESDNDSTINDREEDVNRRKNNKDLDINMLKNIFDAPSAPSEDQDDKTANKFKSSDKPSAETFVQKRNTNNVFGSPEVPSEAMVAVTKSSLASNDTGSTIDYEDRFLSENILRDNWLHNVDEKEKPANTITPRLATMPSDNSAPQPEQHGTPSTGHQKPEPRTISREHTPTPLVPLSEKNASSKHIPRSLLIFLLSIVLCK